MVKGQDERRLHDSGVRAGVCQRRESDRGRYIYLSYMLASQFINSMPGWVEGATESIKGIQTQDQDLRLNQPECSRLWEGLHNKPHVNCSFCPLFSLFLRSSWQSTLVLCLSIWCFTSGFPSSTHPNMTSPPVNTGLYSECLWHTGIITEIHQQKTHLSIQANERTAGCVKPSSSWMLFYVTASFFFLFCFQWFGCSSWASLH